MRNLLDETTIAICGEKLENVAIEQVADFIEWARVRYEDTYDINDKFFLSLDHTKEEAIQFLEKLNFSYENGYGLQHVFGIIMLKNGEWLERAEYDGSEWWEICSKPTW